MVTRTRLGWEQFVIIGLWLVLFSCGFASSVCRGQAPPNDDFTNAIVLQGNSTIFSGTLSNATIEPGESFDLCSGYSPPFGSVWWSWTATNSTTVVIDVVASEGPYAGGFEVHTGSNASSLVEIDCIALDPFLHRYIRFAAIDGTTYRFRASGLDRTFTMRLLGTNTPIVLDPPKSQTVAESGSVMFGVTAGGLQPLTYQWQFAGQPLTGETAPTLILHYLGTNRAGAYSVVVSNIGGMTTSALANLTVSPISPPLLLSSVGVASNYFIFSISGEASRFYRVWASTNLTSWTNEDSLPRDPGGATFVRNVNTTSLYSVPIVGMQKSFRVSNFMNAEICTAQLQAIDYAIRLWAIQNRRAVSDAVSYDAIPPYLNGPLICPSGGTSFSESYGITDALTPPTCKQVPQLHKLHP